MSCLTLRTKSPPDISSSAMTSASSSPAAQLWAKSAKPGAGMRVIGRAARGRGAGLVGGRRGQGGGRRRLEVVEQLGAQALGDEEVALVVDPRQLVAGI